MIHKTLPFLAVVFLLANCASPPRVVTKKYLNDRIKKPYDQTDTIAVYFATNRRRSGGKAECSDTYYSTKISEKITYARCDVNVPAKHAIGQVDYKQSGNPGSYFKFVEDITPKSESKLLSKIEKSKSSEIILFVHGFNVKFEEAVLRAAQIKYDLKFPGEIVLFTWPAGSSGGFFGQFRLNTTYRENQKNAQQTIPVMQDFIKKLSSTGKRVHVIVHSMGHQIVLPAISNLGKKKKKYINQLILNAPDFPAKEFTKIAGNLEEASEQVTVYCSPGDKALVASKTVNKNKRIGSCQKAGKKVVMINVNQVDDAIIALNHGYYSSRPILTDLYQVILGVEPKKRLFIRKSNESSEDYILRK
ncbi:MAG: alpha/beta hydrolase [Spirochaetota bacterium]